MTIRIRFLFRIFQLGFTLLLAVVGSARALSGEVELSEDQKSVTLANTEVALVFDRATGRMSSLKHRGSELLNGGGGYVQVAFTSRYDRGPEKWEFVVIRHEPKLVEIAFRSVDPACPFELAAHYVLRADEPGFYNYLAFGHDATRSPGIHRLAQFNFCLRADPSLFTWAAVDDQRIRPFPDAKILTADRMVMDSTYRMDDGSYYSKYFYSAEMNEAHTVHGVMGAGKGLWIVMPSHEHLNGGPEHQELTVHQTEHTPVLLRHATAAHYGAGMVTSDAKDGSWSKVSAPWFVYINTGSSRNDLWEDAKRRAAAEVTAWPYAWLDTQSFQFDRGAVKGHLMRSDGTDVANARVILAAHEETAAPLDWQQQWRGYRFYGWTDRTGNFTVQKVRPGLYDLYAWQPGAFGTFVRRLIRIEPGTTLALNELEWAGTERRTNLWQIGRPDRSSQEFGFAQDYRQWGLWEKIAAAYPGGVKFVVGQNRTQDWPFQMAVMQNPDASWRPPVWRIEFNLPWGRVGKAYLALGIAAFEGKLDPQLVIKLNGEVVGTVNDLEISGATHRSGEHAGYQEREVIFDANKLKPGVNVLELAMGRPTETPAKLQNTPPAALHWDCLRLEVSK